MEMGLAFNGKEITITTIQITQHFLQKVLSALSESWKFWTHMEKKKKIVKRAGQSRVT